MNVENNLEIQASVGLTRKWDAYKAGIEVAEDAIRKLKSPPDFFLLFSTIHYKKHGGFKKFLEGVWQVLPKGTPLIGGTVGGFINNKGCFSRGATALAVSCPKIDVSLGFAKHTKRKPEFAAKKCAKMIEEGLKDSKYKHKFLINIISGAIVADLPYVGKLNVIRSKFFAWFATNIGAKLFPLIEYGWGRSEDVIESLSSYLPDYYIIGGTSVDSGEYLENYQFIDDKVVKNSIVAMGCKSDLPIFFNSKTSLHETNKIFKITGKSSSGRIIKTLNGLPAKDQILNTFGVVEEQFKDLDSFYYKFTDYFPVAFDENKDYTSGIAGFFGDHIFLGHKSRGDDLRLLSITGVEILDSLDKIFNETNQSHLPYMFMSSSSIFLNTLGAKSYFLKSKMDEYMDDSPYLMIFVLTENAGSPKKPATARVYSFNALSMEN